MFRRWASLAVDLLYPLRCAGCGRFDVALCPACTDSLAPAGGPAHCPFCAAPWEGDGNCPRCIHMAELEGVRAAFEMEGAARNLVHALKYRHFRAVAPLMGALMAAAPAGIEIDTYFAVPLHRSRLKSRGFNQAELLLHHTGWSPAAGGLARVRRTDQQVGHRLGERRANVAGAFVYRGPRLDGQAVAIIDDVITTGATVVECSRVLKDAGAARVWAFAFARASYRAETPEPIDD